jgi:hypothetical protein
VGVVGIVLQAVGGFTLKVAGFFFYGLAAVLAVSAVFYAIGRGEDRERASRDDDDSPR